MPIARVCDRFRLQIDALTNQSNQIHLANKLQAQRPWMIPDPGGSDDDYPNGPFIDTLGKPWDGDPLHLSGDNSIIAAFDRSNIDYGYTRSLETASQQNGGLIADTKASKIQADYVAAMERAYTARHATNIRCAMHQTARKKGHGNQQGLGVFKVVNRVIENTISAGYQG